MDVTLFEAERPRLTAIAARILGSAADAEDVVQESWQRLARSEDVDDLPAWLTTVVTRLCLDHLRRGQSRTTHEGAAPDVGEPTDPEAEAVLAERVSGAMHVVLATLAPAERAAFVLHDVFGYPFDDVSAILGRSSSAVRQLASRARRRVRGTEEPEVAHLDHQRHTEVVDAFLAAARGADMTALLSLLAPDAVMRADLVGQQTGADPAYDGAGAVAARFNGARGARPVTIDGRRAAAWVHAGSVKVAFVFGVHEGLVHEVELIADPDVLATLDIVRDRREPSGTT